MFHSSRQRERAGGFSERKWRVGGLILPIVAAVLVMAAGPRLSVAQPNTITWDGTMSGTCGSDSDCCQTYTLILNQPTTHVYLDFIGDGLGNDCFDATCWAGQDGYPGVLFTHCGTNVLCITFTGGPPKTPDTIVFTICATNNCWLHQDHINWTSDDNPQSHGKLPIWLCAEDGWAGVCGWCDRVDATDNGCYLAVCFEHFSGGPLTGFALHFNPPLRPCNSNDIPDNHQLCHDVPDTMQWSYGWKYHGTDVDADGDTGTLVFDTINSGFVMDACGEVCLTIPKCDPSQNTVVTVTDGGYECLDSGASLPVPMKRTRGNLPDDELLGTDQNYPNPVDASSGFNTTLPFTTSGSGIATIRIVNQSGVEVLKDDEQVTYAGKHFFYFTAKDLAAGTYYYQIEFPQGVVIQSKTMLVVK